MFSRLRYTSTALKNIHCPLLSSSRAISHTPFSVPHSYLSLSPSLLARSWPRHYTSSTPPKNNSTYENNSTETQQHRAPADTETPFVNKDTVLRVLEDLENHRSTEPMLDINTWNNVLQQLAYDGNSVQAQRVHETVFQDPRLIPTLATYTYLMLAYIHGGYYEDAMEVYYEARSHHQPDLSKHTPKSIVMDQSMYLVLLRSLTHVPVPVPVPAPTDTATDTADASSSSGLSTALTLFNDMRQLEIQPTEAIFMAMLNGCALYGDDHVLEKIHRLIRMNSDLDLNSAMDRAILYAYTAVGNSYQVMTLWDSLSASQTSFDNDLVTIVLHSCVHRGYSHRAESIWRVLQQIEFVPTLHHTQLYMEALCQSTVGREGWDKARRLAEQVSTVEREAALDAGLPALAPVLLDTLVYYAPHKGVQQEEMQELSVFLQPSSK